MEQRAPPKRALSARLKLRLREMDTNKFQHPEGKEGQPVRYKMISINMPVSHTRKLMSKVAVLVSIRAVT